MLRMFDLSKQYYFDDDHTNVTLQCMLEEIVADLNELSSSGLNVDGEACIKHIRPQTSNHKFV